MATDEPFAEMARAVTTFSLFQVYSSRCLASSTITCVWAVSVWVAIAMHPFWEMSPARMAFSVLPL